MNFLFQTVKKMGLSVLALNLVFTLNSFAEFEKVRARFAIHKDSPYQLNQLLVPGFEKLPTDRKWFAYYLTKAIEMGGDIVWKQTSRYGLDIRNFALDLIKYRKFTNEATAKALENYLLEVFRNKGNYNLKSNSKILPPALEVSDIDAWITSLHTKKPRVAKNLATQFALLKTHMLDPTVGRTRLALEGDLIKDSNAGFYGTGITLKELEDLPEEQRTHFLSTPYRDKETGEIKLQLHKIGGRFHTELWFIRHYLEKAQNYGNSSEKEIISAYIKAIETGNPEDLLNADSLWVQYKPTDIDWQIGFIETYDDPYGVRGSWEGFVMLLDQRESAKAGFKIVIQNMSAFENKMPVDEIYKRKLGSTPPSTTNTYFISSGGHAGYNPFSAVNLPNDRALVEKYGTKSLNALNRQINLGTFKDLEALKIESDILDKSYSAGALLRRAQFTEDELKEAHLVQVMFHEILGHGSSVMAEGKSEKDLKDMVMPLEEGRAETASLFHYTDKFISDISIVPSNWSPEKFYDYAHLMILSFFTDQMHSWADTLDDDTDVITQAHQWGRQVMFNWMVKSGVLRVEIEDGMPKLKLIDEFDLRNTRQAIGELWNVIQRLKSEADYEGTKALFQPYGAYTDEHRSLRKMMISALDQFKRSTKAIYLNPKFTTKEGDVQISYRRKQRGFGALFNEANRLRKQFRAHEKTYSEELKAIDCEHVSLL